MNDARPTNAPIGMRYLASAFRKDRLKAQEIGRRAREVLLRTVRLLWRE